MFLKTSLTGASSTTLRTLKSFHDILLSLAEEQLQNSLSRNNSEAPKTSSLDALRKFRNHVKRSCLMMFSLGAYVTRLRNDTASMVESRQIPEKDPAKSKTARPICTIITYHIVYCRIARATGQTFKGDFLVL